MERKERKHPGLQVPTQEQTKFKASAQSYSEDYHLRDHPTRQLLSTLGPTSDLMGPGLRDGSDRADKNGGLPAALDCQSFTPSHSEKNGKEDAPWLQSALSSEVLRLVEGELRESRATKVGTIFLLSLA